MRGRSIKAKLNFSPVDEIRVMPGTVSAFVHAEQTNSILANKNFLGIFIKRQLNCFYFYLVCFVTYRNHLQKKLDYSEKAPVCIRYQLQ